MLRRIMLSVFALATGGMTASAADLPTQSRLGAIFAEPAVVLPDIGTFIMPHRQSSRPRAILLARPADQ